MKIDSSNEINTHVRKSVFTETKRPDDKTSSTKQGKGAGAEVAIVEFSERSKDIQRIQQVLQSQPDVRSDKVKAIKEKIEKGTYKIDYEETAGKIIHSFFNDMT
jgi:negative regulator of flagellin synthesis FlgM